MARLGGDEFLVLVEGLARERDAVVVVRKIQRAVARSFSIAGQRIRLTVSIGIATGPSSEAADPDALIARADAAMYRAKKGRCNTYQFFAREPAAQVPHEGA